MLLRFHDLTIELCSADAPVTAQWAELFTGWPAAPAAAYPAVCLELAWRDSLPPLPPASPVFTDQDLHKAVPAILTVYSGGDDTVHLHFHDAGLVTVPLKPAREGEKQSAHGVVLPASRQNGRFEDVTFTSLAPLLRRHGYFLLHAFAAVKDGQALLLVGESGSGKTTTGLRLLLDGWQLLSNDVVLLQARPDGIYALATPDMVTIRPFTLQLLPELRRFLAYPPADQPVVLQAATLTDGRWASPAPVKTIYFPQITGDAHSTAAPLSRAVCLARLMEQSIDQWDTAVFDPHFSLLQRLSQQAAPYTLRLGTDVDQFSRLLLGS